MNDTQISNVLLQLEANILALTELVEHQREHQQSQINDLRLQIEALEKAIAPPTPKPDDRFRT